MPINTPNRRAFLRSAFTFAGTAAPYCLTAKAALSKAPSSRNDRLQVALIGCGGRGRLVAESAAKQADVVAVCDVHLVTA